MTHNEPDHFPDARKMVDLAARIERAEGPGSLELDIEAAELLGWHERRVTGLGLNGRTRGSMLWFPDFAPIGTKGRRRPPRFSGPRMRAATAAAIRARSAS